MGSRSNSSSFPTMPVGLSDPQYLARRKSMFEFLTRVRALGADVELGVPAIASIGWQSAGKSSLVEAISGITLPRASGTCTRCPTECQLTQSENPWTCTVSLQLNTAADGSAHTNPQKIMFGPPITEKLDVTERIRRAQRAVLSPSTPPDTFLNAADTATELSFSTNRIVLDITGPDVTDLNFIDLPGLFVGGEEQEMQLIRNLAVSYIEKPNCIILLTVACETDFVNQGAHRLAREYDPAGDRTIGVLTKPDRIPATEEENWVPYIRGEREDTTMWFCVKCPDSEAIKSGITWEDARRDESLWFSRKVPWATLDEVFKQRLGTANLTRCLSDKLCDLIAERLPQIEQELNKLLERINRDLEDLPPPPSPAPLSEVLRLITDFTREVERQGEGIPGYEGLLHQVKQPQDEFRIAIRRTAPCFVPQFRNKPVLVSGVAQPIAVSNSRFVLPPAKKLARPPFLVREEDSEEIGLDDGNKIFIDDVLETAECAVTRELPNTYPFVVQKGYIKAFVGKWNEPAHALFKTIAEKVKEATLRIVETHFGNYMHSRFKQRVSNIVVAHLDQCLKETSDQIKFLLKVEMEPSTRNTNYFKDYHRKFLSFYKGLFHEDSNDCFVERVQGRMDQSSEFSRTLDTIISNLPKIGFSHVTPLDLGVLLQASEGSSNALKIMADVRAYFQVSYKRFVDNAVKAIDEELVLGISNELQEALISGLKLDSPDAQDTCAKLVAEQPHTAEKRKNLVAAQKKLLLARDELYNVLT